MEKDLNNASPYDDYHSGENINNLVMHNACGLPVELCICPDAPIVYDWETGTFIIKKK